ncbi:hypothetical protein Fmac_009116 [Flemingia macrophylla]|uniref:Protein kinase domain-containing protein n=1 Tax=Flemingia macrophylla TaxID=520843 RepID=A0ABD1MZW2_9FABA
MNQYHIYEAIGRGKHSTVYKGRKKKTIEYFAIKSVDKSQKTKVLEEVRILHTLDHVNVLKFHEWYETSAHLWLVLEYCVGGDLLSILQQDSQLPEDSVHDLAYDLVKALQFLHSNGIIYCDLKPSNILLDENGCAKLCDFGLARKLKDISKAPSPLLSTRAKRGTPYYMAPELFEDGGVHSYASDFWALGCVLYECYAGRPPFVARELTQLVKSIISDPTPPLPGNPSRPFVNLINSLLVKDPAERIQWPELCGHAFWGTKFTLVPLPAQPAFDDMIGLHAKPCLQERNGDKSLHSRTPPKYREKDVKGKKDENSVLGTRGIETPTRATPNGHRTQTKGSGRTLEIKQKDSSNISKGVNLLRLSRIAKSNLQKENEKENYRRPLPNNSENDSEVKIENTDMELDFNENTEDDAHEETDGAEHTTPVPQEKMDNHFLYQGKAGEYENNTHQLDTPSAVNTPASDDPKSFDHESTPDCPDISAFSPSLSPQVRKQHRGAKEDSGSTLESDSSRSSNDLSQVLWHPSDLSVRPVMPGRKVDKGSEVIPSLPFEALQASDFVKTPKEQSEAVLNRILAILNGNTSIGEKQNVLRYLEMLSSNADAANILTNGPIMLMLVKLLRQSKASALRVQLASLIGLLIRHSTFVDDSLANSGILGALTDGLRDRQEKVRRFSMAALGELLFYISTQNADGKDNSQLESPSKDNRTTYGWQVPNSLISFVSSILRKGEDDITQLYALRTIENICSQGGFWVGRLTSQDVISNLCYIYRAAGKQESMRLTAGSCLVRLVRFNSPSIQSVIEKLSFKDLASALFKGSPRDQQISLNLLNMAILGNTFTNIGRYLLPLAEDKNLIPSLLALVEQGTEVLRGKALVLVALLCKHGRRWLPHFFCSQKLLSVVDRLGKEKDAYVRQCLDAFVPTVASSIPGLLDIITGDIQQIMGGRRHGHISALTSRSASKTNIHLFPVVLHLLGSSTFKNKVVTPQVLRQLANLIKFIETPFQGRDDFQITLLRIFESLTEESPVILDNPDIFIREILPSLTVLYKGNKDGDARFLCLKILFDVMIILLSEPIEEEQRLQDLKFISNTRFLPLYPTLIEDEDPIPIYAQKLLVMLLEFGFITIPDILHLKTISQCFEFLLGDLSNANVNNVKLCLALASAPEMESKILSHLKVVRRIGNFLEFVYAKGMDDLLEPTLGLCRAFLARSVSCSKGFSHTTEPTLLGECPSEFSGGAIDPQQCIKDIADFGSNVSVLLELSASTETTIADIASECVVLLLKAAPREATTGILTNLPKVTVILETWNRGIPHLMVQRMLHALGYACKQYLLHAMILSISIPEISRIEVIVSDLKSSGVPALAKTAGLAAMELQRLPRCI